MELTTQTNSSNIPPALVLCNPQSSASGTLVSVCVSHHSASAWLCARCVCCRAALDEFGLSRLSNYDPDLSLGTDSSEADASSSEGVSTAAGYSQEDSSTSVPRTDMQRLRQELLLRTRRMVRRHRQQAANSSSSSGSQDAQQEAAAAAAEADDGAAGGSGSEAAGLHQKLDSIRAMIRANSDRWGTTQQSPAEIAQQIADSNRAAAGGGGGAGGGSDGEEGSDDDDGPLTLNPGEERYADPSTVGAELKEMDEIFEVLAKVGREGGLGQ